MGSSSLMQRLSQSCARDCFEPLSQVSQVSQTIYPHLQPASKPCLKCRNCPNGFSSANSRYIHVGNPVPGVATVPAFSPHPACCIKAPVSSAATVPNILPHKVMRKEEL